RKGVRSHSHLPCGKGGTGVFSARPAGHNGPESARKGRWGQDESSGHSVTAPGWGLRAILALIRRFGVLPRRVSAGSRRPANTVPIQLPVSGTPAMSPTEGRYLIRSGRASFCRNGRRKNVGSWSDPRTEVLQQPFRHADIDDVHLARKPIGARRV